MSKPRLLLIDENPEDRALARLVLLAQYPGAIVDNAGNEAEFLEALDEGFYDIVVTELDTGWASGSFLLEAIHENQPRAAIVVFTRRDDRQAAVDALKAGAADFVIKSSAGFLDLRRAAAEVLPELAGERSLRDPGPREAAPAVPDAQDGWAIPGSPIVESASEAIPTAAPVMPEPSEAPSREDEPPRATLLETDPALMIASTPATAAIESQVDSSVQPQTEPFREAVENARQSISNVAHRPLGAVLGIIAILAAFIVLYATFFSDGSDSVEAGAPTSLAAAGASGDSLPPAVEPHVAVAPEVPVASSGAAPQNPNPAPPGIAPDEPSVRSVPAPVVLELRAESEVWIQVTVDGIPVFDAVLAPGQTQRFEGRQMATLLIGNAAGLSVIWNGEDIGTLGREGQVRRLYFSPSEVGVGPPPS